MVKFQVICPECGASVVTPHPEALVWERCPGCGSHMWDTYDLMMAEAVSEKRPHTRAAGVMS